MQYTQVNFTRAYWGKLKKGDVVFDILDHDDVQFVIRIAKSRKLIKFEDLTKGMVYWTTQMRYEQKRYYYLDK